MAATGDSGRSSAALMVASASSRIGKISPRFKLALNRPE
jgi:hypothetical protein